MVALSWSDLLTIFRISLMKSVYWSSRAGLCILYLRMILSCTQLSREIQPHLMQKERSDIRDTNTKAVNEVQLQA